jgi:hypothetical protein
MMVLHLPRDSAGIFAVPDSKPIIMNSITRKRLSIFLFILSITISNAQVRFQKTLGGAVLDWSNCIIPTTDSSLIMLGSTKNFGAGLQDILLVKTTLTGDTLWCKALGLSAGDEEGATVQQTTDGGFMITGTTGSAGGGGDDFLLIKTDAAGTVQWSKTFGGPNVEFCSGGKQLFDGGYILTGNSSSYGAGAADIYLVRTDGNGDTLWTHTYGTSGVDYAYGIAQTTDSGFIITGSSIYNGTSDLILLKTNSTGVVEWSKAYGGSGIEAGYAVVQTTDGYCAAGSTTSYGTGAMDAFLVKTDQNGDLSWSQTYGTSDSDIVYSMKPTADGGYIMTGYAHRSSNINDEVLLLKTDGNGNMQWATVMGGTSVARDVGRCVFESSDGGFVISGFTQSFAGGTEVYFIKTDPQGNAGCNMLNIPITSATVTPVYNAAILTVKSGAVVTSPTVLVNAAPANFNTLCSSVAVNENELHIDVAVYPNPITDHAAIMVTGNADDDLMLTISDISGSVIAHYLTSQNQSGKSIFNISRGTLSPGIYFYSVYSRNSSGIRSGKLIIQDN